MSVALLGAAVGITIESIREIPTPHHTPAPFTLVVLVGVIAAKELMFRVLHRTGKAIGSSAMQTDAWHHRSDSLTSAAAFLGISIAILAGEGYESADDWAALFAAGVIAFNGSKLLRSALREVLDVAPPPRRWSVFAGSRRPCLASPKSTSAACGEAGWRCSSRSTSSSTAL